MLESLTIRLSLVTDGKHYLIEDMIDVLLSIGNMYSYGEKFHFEKLKSSCQKNRFTKIFYVKLYLLNPKKYLQVEYHVVIYVEYLAKAAKNRRAR